MKRLRQLNKDTDIWLGVFAKHSSLPRMGCSCSQLGHPARFSYSVAMESRTTCWGESCLLPHRKRILLYADSRLLSENVIFCQLGMMECAVLSQAWLVGGDGDTEGWWLPRCYATRDICWKNEDWLRWSLWREKRLPPRQENHNPLTTNQSKSHMYTGYYYVVVRHRCKNVFFLSGVKVSQNYPPFLSL